MSKFIITRLLPELDNDLEQAVYNGDGEAIVWDSSRQAYGDPTKTEFDEMIEDLKHLREKYTGIKYQVFELKEYFL